MRSSWCGTDGTEQPLAQAGWCGAGGTGTLWGSKEILLMALTSEQLNDLVERYCDRVVDDMSKKEMEQMVYELLTDSFAQKEMEQMVYEFLTDSFAYESETHMEALICSIYGEDYYNKLVEEVTAA
jgi:hypothetical protein